MIVLTSNESPCLATSFSYLASAHQVFILHFLQPYVFLDTAVSFVIFCIFNIASILVFLSFCAHSLLSSMFSLLTSSLNSLSLHMA